MRSRKEYLRILDLFIIGALYFMTAVLLYRTPEEQMVNSMELFITSQLALFWFFRIFSKRKISYKEKKE